MPTSNPPQPEQDAAAAALTATSSHRELELLHRRAASPVTPLPHQRYRTVTKLRGAGLRFVNGVASCYAGAYPYKELRALQRHRLVSEAAFHAALDRVNNALLMHWPCAAVYFCGFACTPCTLGLSLWGGPRVCVAEAERKARFELECLNGSALFVGAGMRWELRKACCASSWIEVQLLVEGEEEAAIGGRQQQQQQQQQQEGDRGE